MTVEARNFCRGFAGAAVALGLALTGCTEFEANEHDDIDGEVEPRSAFKGFEKDFETATQEILWVELHESEFGNVRVTAGLPAQDGKKSFALRGPEDSPFVLRDDGQLGDEKAGDGIFTALADVDLDQLKQRSEEDKQAIEQEKVSEVPVFHGRVQVGTTPAVAFDFDGFIGGKRVPFRPSSIYQWFPVIPERSLMVTDLAVVNDPTRTYDPCTNVGTPGGAYTFGRLMTEMAGPNPPADFVEDWLDHWLTNVTVNGHTALSRADIEAKIIDPWRTASGGPNAALNLDLAPFRLLAIVNRVDLRGGGSAYGGGNAGELRLVFGLVDLNNSCSPEPMTVIFEYGVPRSGCIDVRDWARSWWHLRWWAPGSLSYRNALAALVEEVVVAGADPSKPNESAINQVRTNEIALDLGTGAWELREFRLGQAADPDELIQTTVALTPDDDFKPVQLNAGNPFPALVSGHPAIDNYINSNLGSLCPPTPVLPQHDFTGAFANLLAASSLSPGDPDQPPPAAFVFWKMLTNSDNFNKTCHRHTLSVNTCNGCHAGETETTSFVHVDPSTPLGNPAALSGFLTGISVPDPAGGGLTRNFNDLQRRAQDLKGLASSTCFSFPFIEKATAADLQKSDALPPPDQLFSKDKKTSVVVEDLVHFAPPVH